jgi:hypothetical protein
MRHYTVHVPPGSPSAEDRFVFVKEGFCWPALLIPHLWLLYRRLWIVLAIYVAVSVGIAVLESYDFAILSAALGALMALLLGFEGNQLRRWGLARRSFSFAGVASGGSLAEAEIRFFHGWAEQRRADPEPPRVSTVAVINPRPVPSGVIGLFPVSDATP